MTGGQPQLDELYRRIAELREQLYAALAVLIALGFDVSDFLS